MKERPKVQLVLKQADKTVEIIGWLLHLALWGLALVKYQSLSDIIPTHYNAAGVTDGFGNK